MTIGEKPVPLAGIIAVARRGATVVLSGKAAFRKRIESSRRLLQKAIEADIPVYGVTTGYGKSCGNRLNRKSLPTNGENLMRFHGCGTGEPLGVEETRAAMLCRLLCLARGYSGVSFPLLEQLAAFLNLGITPVIPSEGSVGASGDLTPLSYLLAALAGEREVFYRGERMPSARALRKAKLKPYVCQPKEPLAMVNGTSVMTGIAAVVLDRAHHLLEAAIAASALSVHALQGEGPPLPPRDRRGQTLPGTDLTSPRSSGSSWRPGYHERISRRTDRRPCRTPTRCAAPPRSWASWPTPWPGCGPGWRSRRTAPTTTPSSTGRRRIP